MAPLRRHANSLKLNTKSFPVLCLYAALIRKQGRFNNDNLSRHLQLKLRRRVYTVCQDQCSISNYETQFSVDSNVHLSSLYLSYKEPISISEMRPSQVEVAAHLLRRSLDVMLKP
jgi:hypothetical protein